MKFGDTSPFRELGREGRGKGGGEREEGEGREQREKGKGRGREKGGEGGGRERYTSEISHALIQAS